mgnify:FL=1
MAETVNYLSYYHSPDIENLFILRLRKNTDKDLKNHYIISMKTSITNGKNTYKKQVCNQQQIN